MRKIIYTISFVEMISAPMRILRNKKPLRERDILTKAKIKNHPLFSASWRIDINCIEIIIKDFP
ncbi:MAG: hypothetical protein WC678_04360 [Parcubacteria group bacterium]|jgi:hypothetical protein